MDVNKTKDTSMYVVDENGNYQTNVEWLSKSYMHLKKKYYDLKRLAPNAKHYAYKVGQLMDKLSLQDEQVRELEEKVEKQRIRISELEQIVQNRSSIDTTDMVVLEVDGKRLGAYVPQSLYVKRIEEIKQLKEKYNDK